MSNYIPSSKLCPEKILECQLLINPKETTQPDNPKEKIIEIQQLKEKKFEIEIYKEDVKIKLKKEEGKKILIQSKLKKKLKNGSYKKKKEDDKKRGIKKPIKEFTNKSRKSLKFFIKNSKIEFKNIITLTYPKEFPTDGKEVKYHLNRFTKLLNKMNCSYIWVIEFQERGAPHFHILTNTFIDKKNISESWYKIVKSGDEKHLKAGTQCEKLRKGIKAARSYIMKYISKSEQKTVPKNYEKIGRFWGRSEEKLENQKIEIDSKIVELIKANYELKIREWLNNKTTYEKINEIMDKIYNSDNVILWSFSNETKDIIDSIDDKKTA